LETLRGGKANIGEHDRRAKKIEGASAVRLLRPLSIVPQSF